MIHAIDKCVIATVVEVVQQTTYTIVRSIHGRRRVHMVAVGASVAMWRWHKVIAMGRVVVGAITVGRRRVAVILLMGFILIVTVATSAGRVVAIIAIYVTVAIGLRVGAIVALYHHSIATARVSSAIVHHTATATA